MNSDNVLVSKIKLVMKKSTNGLSWVLLIILLSLGSFGCLHPQTTPATKLEIKRDDKGVWYITGPKTAGVYDIYEKMGYAVATDRLWEAEFKRIKAAGRLAELLGSGVSGYNLIDIDKYTHATRYTKKALLEIFESLDQTSRDIVNGYVAGFNRRIAEVQAIESILPFEFKHFKWPLSNWTALDILSCVIDLQRAFDPEASIISNKMQLENVTLYEELRKKFPQNYSDMFNDLRWANDPDTLTYIPTKHTTHGSPDTVKTQPITGNLNLALRSDDTEKLNQRYSNMMNTLAAFNAYTKAGSYAWVVSGNKTASGNPILYSGPQMGFAAPSLATQGCIRAGGLDVFGLALTAVPAISVGVTPHHAWSVQVGQAHTVDYYYEKAQDVAYDREEIIKVKNGAEIKFKIYKTDHGPVIHPIDYDPQDPGDTIISWKYAHRNHEFGYLKANYDMAQAQNMDEFGRAIEQLGISLHICYADKDNNIAYWMSGRDPVRPTGADYDYRFPQGYFPDRPIAEWDSTILKPRSTNRNTEQGFYGGWNNKCQADYGNSYNNYFYMFGPFHRAQVIHDFLNSGNKFTFEDIRDLAIEIGVTDAFKSAKYDASGNPVGNGGNPWKFIDRDFSKAVNENPTQDRLNALRILNEWNGRFVDGTLRNNRQEWISGTSRSDGWMLMDSWIREVLRMTFADELNIKTSGNGPTIYDRERPHILFNTLLHALPNNATRLVTGYDWFRNLDDPGAPQTWEDIVVKALDSALSKLGNRPWGINKRGVITYRHVILGAMKQTTPYSCRATYGHVVEYASNGPKRVESLFSLGQSGTILGSTEAPKYNENFFDMLPMFNAFDHRAINPPE
ncbi:MAG: penicillin acylase family protein [Deltaproteobacteria bacterium]|nr:penicillin acylase family protein [Deltaproteobacteria bacterium]